jgi:hypothetical protein
MINVNEAIGYRLSRIFAEFQLLLNSPVSAGAEAEMATTGG